MFSPAWDRRSFLIAVEPEVFIPADLDDYMVYWVFVNGYHRDGTVRLSRKLIREGDTVVDVGANIGLWVMGAAKRAGESGKVHAIEPIPDNYSRLVSNLELNGLGSVETAKIAIADRSGRSTMFRPDYDNSGHPTLARREGVEHPIEVEALTLDEYCSRSGIEKLDFLKVDVEGAELLVFRGAKETLSTERAPAILFEVNEETAARLDSSTADVKALLRDLGYDLYRYDGVRLTRVAVELAESPGDLFAFKAHHYEKFPWLSLVSSGAAS